MGVGLGSMGVGLGLGVSAGAKIGVGLVEPFKEEGVACALTKASSCRFFNSSASFFYAAHLAAIDGFFAEVVAARRDLNTLRHAIFFSNSVSLVLYYF